MAIAMLYQAIPENMVLQIANLTSAKEIWEALKVRHVGVERVKEARVQTLESDFESLKMGANEPLDVYAGKISEIASQASNLGHTLDEKRQVRKLLGSVPAKFIQIVAAIEQFADLNKMSFQEAVGRLKAFEEPTKKEIKEEDGPKDFGRGQGRGRGSGRSQGDGRAQRDKSNVKCFKCNELGHFSNECPKWENKKDEANLIQYEDDEPTLLYTSCKDEEEDLI
ncbi:zinc finger, CCHC-type [Artemisia annua]|uniref:Zinc finger, CCHC-type n=1 Tax=Artemisia annua TaxID=35608 RepID=A0A2U1MW09_ARTAN|nr:zinc finger, CCHC-type [Artemisia annua]